MGKGCTISPELVTIHIPEQVLKYLVKVGGLGGVEGCRDAEETAWGIKVNFCPLPPMALLFSYNPG